MAAQGPHGIQFEAYRPVVMARNGMVCSGHPLASQAGISVLQRGGNAVDAAIATAAALNVVEPNMSGIGGDGFIMIYWKQSGSVQVVNATGAAPAAATLEAYRDGIPMKGIRSVSVPGLLAGWLEAHARYGSLALEQVLEPAISLAQDGFPVSHRLAEGIAADASLREFPSSRAIFTRDGRPLQAGELLVQRDLAETFRRIAAGGAEEFYRGETARKIVACSERYGGLLTLEDLAACRAVWQEPISTTYRGYTVYEAPPNSSGHVLLQELNLVELFDLRSLGCNTAASIHLMVEAKKLAFADREEYLADPDFVDVPIAGVLSKAYARERARLINLERAALPGTVRPGDPGAFQPQGRPAVTRPGRRASGVRREDTTCFVVADRWGNAVCQLQSLQSGFGSGLVADGTGVLLNNRMTYWHLDPQHVDCLEPGKRVRHTMNPVMVFRDGRLILALGTPGADTQVQTNLQLITHILDFGMTPVEAVEAPRWRHIQSPMESTVPHTAEDALNLEARFSEDTVRGLVLRGHPVQVIGPWAAVGSAMVIQVDLATGAYWGAADPRRDGYAIGW
jgi:gamma-glutamyltranspeptidase/glutathione hydrolase